MSTWVLIAAIPVGFATLLAVSACMLSSRLSQSLDDPVPCLMSEDSLGFALATAIPAGDARA
jgi:hypothetical protein